MRTEAGGSLPARPFSVTLAGLGHFPPSRASSDTMQKTAGIPDFSPSKGTLLHRQLFLVLRERILRGAFLPTGALPKEKDLCEHFGVSQITVRRALADLAAAGLVQRRHGLGTFVLDGATPPRPPLNLSVIEELRRAAHETDVAVLTVERTRPPQEVADLLELPDDQLAVCAIRLRSVDGVPVMLTDAWVPERLRKGVTASKLRRMALYEVLLGQGITFGRVVQEFSSVLADPVRARHLDVEVGSPLLRLVRVMHAEVGGPILHLTVFLPSERSRVLMEIPGDTVNTLSAGRIVHDVA